MKREDRRHRIDFEIDRAISDVDKSAVRLNSILDDMLKLKGIKHL